MSRSLVDRHGLARMKLDRREPHERLGVSVAVIEVVDDGRDQVIEIEQGAAAQAPFGEDGEE